jgi:hypothetical protein
VHEIQAGIKTSEWAYTGMMQCVGIFAEDTGYA